MTLKDILIAGKLTISEGGGGGGYTLEEVVEGTISGDIIYTGTKLRSCQFMGDVPITSFIGDSVVGFANDAVGSERAVWKGNTHIEGISMALYDVTSNAESMFYGCSALKKLNLPSLSRLVTGTIRACTSLQAVNFPSVIYVAAHSARNCTNLKAIDFSKNVRIAGGEAFAYDTALDTLVLRSDTVCPLETINNFTGTPFASGGAGGTLYVPSATISAYQSANIWSTILGYANNQIKAIEGSFYETHYADGTPIA